jgi:excisionase family DNA binding protein
LKKFSVKQVAQNLERSQDFIRDEISKRRIAHLRIGGRLYVTESDLHAYIQRCRVAAYGESVQKKSQGAAA